MFKKKIRDIVIILIISFILFSLIKGYFPDINKVLLFLIIVTGIYFAYEETVLKDIINNITS